MSVAAAIAADEVLTTTRAVRRVLDLDRPVERHLFEEAIAIAQQAPSGGNQQDWGFVVVTEPATKQALADLYRRAREETSPKLDDPAVAAFLGSLPEDERGAFVRMMGSADHLAEHLHEVPVLVVPTVGGRGATPVSLPGRDAMATSWAAQAVVWGGIAPATWSFKLAARARGLGTAWTTLHLRYEKEAADLLGIPYPEVAQAALIPVAHVTGNPFKAGRRQPPESVIHWERWRAA